MEYVGYVALLVLSFIAGLFIKNYFPSYMNEKGKNLATKEDVREVTDKIENVRFEYLQRLEGVKSDLTLNEKQKSRIKEKEIEILLSFFEKCAHLEEKLVFNFGNLTYSEKLYPVEYQKYMDNLFWEIRVSRTRLYLYLPLEHNLQIKAQSLFVQCSEIRTVFNKYFGKFKIALIEEMEALAEEKDKDVLHKICETTDDANKEYNTALKPVLEKFSREFNEFLIEIQNHFSGVNNESIVKPDSKTPVK